MSCSDVYEAEFSIDYEQISDTLDLKSTGSVSTGKVAYFDEDFLVLFLNFTAPFSGTSGSTNVIVDLTEDKANQAAYLVNLGLQ